MLQRFWTVLFGAQIALTACGSGVDPVISDHERIVADGQFLSLSHLGATAHDSTFSLRLIASVTPPTVSSTRLQATDLHLVDKRAFISYNAAGATQLGAVDVVDVSKITNPRMISSLELPNHDANAIYKHKSNVYAVGAIDTGGAMLLQIPYSGSTLSESFTSYSLESFAGTDVSVSGNRIVATSGDAGGLEIFSKTSLEREAYLSLTDARGVSGGARDGNFRVILGQPGAVSVVDDDGELISSKGLGGNSIVESKSTIESAKDTSILSLGDGGWKIICNDDSSSLASVSAVTVSGLTPGETVTNAVSMDDGLAFAANGEVGVYVYSLKTGSRVSNTRCYQISANLLGSIRFNTDESSNHIVYRKGYLFVASGLGGFRILSVSKVKVDGDFDDRDDDDDLDDRDED